MSLPEKQCVVLGCQRAVMRHGDWTYNRCQRHVSHIQTRAFAEPPIDFVKFRRRYEPQRAA